MSLGSAGRGRARIVVGLLTVAVGLTMLVAAPRAAATERVVHVPGDHPTVQAAVDASRPGDLILVAPGTYHEDVIIDVDQGGIVIRGLDRNAVIFDGRDPDSGEVTLLSAFLVYADDVTIENMTARYYDANGFKWESVDGFAGRYLTGHNLGLYALYAFDSTNGVFEDSYGSGVADAAIYVGQCDPCNITVRRVISQFSALGFSGTNASGGLVLEDSEWSHNGSGILPNTLDGQRYAPQDGAVIRNNVIKNNGNLDTPAIGYTGAAIGMGVGIGGGNDNLVEGNEITGNSQWGIVVFPLPDQTFWQAHDNVIRDNVLRDNGSGDPLLDETLGYADLAIAVTTGSGNCFAGNDYVTSAPPLIEEAFPCEGTALDAVLGAGDPRTGASLARDYAAWEARISERTARYEDMPEPGPQPTMPAPDPTAGAAPTPPASPAEPGLPATGPGLGIVLLGALLAVAGLLARRSPSRAR